MPEHLFPTIPQLAEQFRTGISTPGDLADHLFSRIDRLDEKLHAFLVLTKERAFREAGKTDSVIKSDSFAGPLQGIPFAAKDLFDVQGLPTTAGCRLLSQNIARKDSAAVQRLSRAGMVLLGKTNTVQFAFGGVGINHDQGSPLNPWMSAAYIPGGSSSGSAVAVAAGLVPVALGTDTGGSVRIPAALCGIVGLKTTVGRISRSGVYPLSWTLDSVGVLTRSVEDAALVYRTLQGPDPEDESTLNVPPANGLSKLKEGVNGLRLAFGETIFFDEVAPEIERAVRETGKVFQSLGAGVDKLEVPEAAEALASENRALMIAAEACVVNEDLLKNHFDQLDPIIAQRMMTGWKLSAPDYLAELRKWKALQARIIHSLKDIDALLVPTTMIPARPQAEVDSSLETYLKYNGKYLRNTTLGNILNFCAVSVPCGFTREGLPIGLMIYAKPFQEESALRVAYAYEQATEWHTRQPDLS
jgi:aspartyl-tRNA(Asn)/glutamyl-tRNA(Gln) amidotransferase subunit A